MDRFPKKLLDKLNLKSWFIPSDSAIRCCKVSGNNRVKSTTEQLQGMGFNVKPIMSPTINTGEERLQFCLHNYSTEKQIKEVLNLLKTIIKE